MNPPGLSAEALKACCADFYSADWVAWLLGGSFHPGGAPLTRRLAHLLSLAPDMRVLDVAAGQGDSVHLLAEELGCIVVGVDLQHRSAATRWASVVLLQADAEALPFQGERFHAAICECSLCLFPDKQAALAEVHRVLRPGGRVGIADLVVAQGTTPPELRGLAAYVTCVGAALPLEELLELTREAGFVDIRWEDHGEALQDVIRSVHARLAAVKAAVALGKLALPGQTDVDAILRAVRWADAYVKEGRASYGLLVATKES